MSDKGLLEIAHRLVADEDYRERFLLDPGAVLADLGVSAEAYRALTALVPILLVGGIGLVNTALAENPISTSRVGWGRG